MQLNFLVAAVLAALSLAACTTTNEVPVAPNVVRLDTSASGFLFTGNAGKDTLKAAAQTTLAHGYRYFKFADVQSGSGSQFAGLVTSGNANVYGGHGWANVYGSSVATPIFAPTAQVGATVIMSNTKDDGSWDAQEVLAEK